MPLLFTRWRSGGWEKWEVEREEKKKERVGRDKGQMETEAMSRWAGILDVWAGLSTEMKMWTYNLEVLIFFFITQVIFDIFIKFSKITKIVSKLFLIEYFFKRNFRLIVNLNRKCIACVPWPTHADSPIKDIYSTAIHFLQPMNLHWHMVIIHSLLFTLRFSLCCSSW